MKKMFSIVLIVSLLVGCSSVSLAISDRETCIGHGFYYTYNFLEDGSVEITGCRLEFPFTELNLEIPAVLDGFPVSSIAYQLNSAKLDNVSTISIPNSITSIKGNPFRWLYSLSSIEVSPDHPTLALIDGVLFSKPDKRLVCYPHALKKTVYSIPQGIKTIGDYAFCNCNKLLTLIEIPDSVTSIGDSAFSGANLMSISIPDSVTTIGNNAFSDCSNLTSITIPNSVTSIGDYTFSECENLTSISIPDSVTTIGNNAFSYCSNLTSITIPDSVSSIGDDAFSWCEKLASISIPNSVKTIVSNPFIGCSLLSSIITSSDHPYFGIIDGALFSKPDKRLVCYPYAFTKTNYSIPHEIQIIGSNAFSYCSNLTSITIPDSVTIIGEKAFYECSNLTSVTTPDSSNLTSVTIPDSVTSIGEKAFYECNNLTSVTIPDSVTSIGSWAFSYKAVFHVERDSYAVQYCKKHGSEYIYPDANDWLNN